MAGPRRSRRGPRRASSRALVTANGGLVSHAAVTARELGIPAINDAMVRRRVRTGTLVTVDPVRATVTAVSE